MADVVYILSNPAFPDNLIKVGTTTTTNLEKRIRDLSRPEGVPFPFECIYACEVKDGKDTEKRILEGFKDHRENPRREFLRINPERVRIILEGFELSDVTPKSDIVDDEVDAETLHRVNARRPNFRFSKVDIPIGATLYYIRNKDITCIVRDDRKVEFRGELMYLSRAAEIVLKEDNVVWTTYGGPHHWVYEDDESLSERRFRMEQATATDSLDNG